MREATGLIRSMSTLDAFWLNLYAATPLPGVVFGFLYAFTIFPNAYAPAAYVIGGLGYTLLSVVYAYLSAAMPRSGGNYIFQSRVLHPALGFGSSLNDQFW